jgi:hypothetical protein
MFGRAGFELLRHRILLGLRHAPPPPELRQSRWRDSPIWVALPCYSSSQLGGETQWVSVVAGAEVMEPGFGVGEQVEDDDQDGASHGGVGLVGSLLRWLMVRAVRGVAMQAG